MTTILIHGSVVSFQPERRTNATGSYGVIDEVGEAPIMLWPGLNTGFSIDVEESFEEIQHNPAHSEIAHTLEQVRNAKVGEDLAFGITVHPQIDAHWPLLKFATGSAYGLGDQPDSTTWMKQLDGKWSRFTGIMMEDVKVEIPGVGVVKESYSGFAGHRMAIADATPGYTEAIEDLTRALVWNDISAVQMGIIGSGAWSLKTTPDVEKDLQSICYGNGLYVAFANESADDRIMTSPDGKVWTIQTTPAGDQTWQSICYGNGLFVAVAGSSISNTDRVMTSPDGITWTLRTSVDKDNAWQSITHANDLFVAVSNTGTIDMVMTSVDAITWTSRVTPAGNNAWQGITYGNGLYVAVADSGTLDRVMTSPDGIMWTLKVTPAGDNDWMSIICVNGLYVAVGETGTENRVMTSLSTVVDIPHCVSDMAFGFTNEVVKALDVPIVLTTGIADVRVVSRKMFVSLKLNWISQVFIDIVAAGERIYLKFVIGASPNETTFEFWGLKWPKYIAKAVPTEVIGDTITSIPDLPGFRYSTR